jgi:hypothetical protein
MRTKKAARPAPGRGDTVAQLQHDIDSEQTGAKASGFDPAAAPLGTDDEAAGTPPSPEVVAQARVLERRSGLDTNRNATKSALASEERAGVETHWPLIAAFLAILIMACIGAVILGS